MIVLHPLSKQFFTFFGTSSCFRLNMLDMFCFKSMPNTYSKSQLLLLYSKKLEKELVFNDALKTEKWL